MRAKLINRNLRANRNAARLARMDGVSRRLHVLVYGDPLGVRTKGRIAMFQRTLESRNGYRIRYIDMEY